MRPVEAEYIMCLLFTWNFGTGFAVSGSFELRSKRIILEIAGKTGRESSTLT